MPTASRCRKTAGELAKKIADALLATLSGVPDATVADDWDYLCTQIASDLAVDPQKTLALLRGCLDELLQGPQSQQDEVALGASSHSSTNSLAGSRLRRFVFAEALWA